MDRNKKALHIHQVEEMDKRIEDEKKQSGFKKAVQLEDLLSTVPTSYENPQKGEIVILTPDLKALIIYYAFIGLSELVAASSGKTQKFVWEGCIKRAMVNLHKDGLL
jgi:hypothetical protein